jgi:uncharacterized membrane protein YdbT with pleckstrin-like domain
MESQEPHQPEHTLWSGKRSQWCFAGYWLSGLAIAAAMIAGIYFNQQALARWMPWAYGAPVLALLAASMAVAMARSRWSYRVTNRRVIAEYGVVMKDTNEIRIQDIRSINVSRKGLAGLFGVGRVEFSSAAADDAEVIFYKIGNANGVRDLVRKLQN